MATTAATHDDHAHDDHAHDHPTGWRRFVYSTNHKDIGTMYLVFAIIAGIIGAAMSIAIRMTSAHLSGAEVSLGGSRVQRDKPPNPNVREGSLQQTNARPDHTLGQSRHFDRAPFTSGLPRLAAIL